MQNKSNLTPKQQLIAQRRVARRLALTACYQWQMTGDSFQDIYTYYQEDKDQKKELQKADIEFFKLLTTGTMEQCTTLEGEYRDFSEAPIDQLEPIVRCVLLLSAVELKSSFEAPYKVVINEWINLSKKYGGEQSHVYVNGMLKHIVSLYRAMEVSADSASADKLDLDAADKPSAESRDEAKGSKHSVIIKDARDVAKKSAARRKVPQKRMGASGKTFDPKSTPGVTKGDNASAPILRLKDIKAKSAVTDKAGASEATPANPAALDIAKDNLIQSEDGTKK